ncbi:MAG: methyltransferase domain-containing protein [Patescibacteria group bacterium]|nr:methyltransferase domain-containing protein [Patescibacteria group bacterium]
MNQWDVISNFFDVRVKDDKVQGGAMDNILIAWPPIVHYINKYFPQINELDALDFGCGVGEFCYKLDQMGFNVTGIDSSGRMIKKASSYLPKKINLIKGNSNILSPTHKYDVIASIQTVQFIRNIKKTLSNLDKTLKRNGLMIFTTFNPKFVKNCIRDNVLLVDFDSDTNPKKGFFCLGDEIRIPTYIRTAEEYENMLTDIGYKKVFEDYPPFTKEFLKKYPLKVPPNKVAPSKDPEYMILGFVKK